ncbi:MAG: twin-arginine translocase TatA/TatE family subunit [Desulfobulbaceae bacterium]|nr:twin-arginine translocase TatA/TatE family subunit [Desulfobulbaceae bacterium]
MFGLGMPELIVIMGITFLVFGGKKLPELGAGLGKGIKAFKVGLHDMDGGKASAEEKDLGGKAVAALDNEV